MTFELLHSLVLVLVYLALGAWLLRRPVSSGRDFLFSLLNVAGVYGLFFFGRGRDFQLFFLIYLAVLGLQYLMLRVFAQRPGALPWLAFFTPIAALLVVRYAPAAGFKLVGSPFPITPYFVGISYLAFRSSHLVLLVRNGQVPPPSLWNYLSFCFFVPTLQVGPISPYTEFYQAFTPPPVEIPVGRSALRMLVGAVKYQFLASLCGQLDYANLLLDDHYHAWRDLPVAMVFYYLYLYFNFSGFCDLAIGAAGLMGVPVAENFNNPLAARNLREFWNRWHITLSQYMRDVVFAPLSQALVRWLGPARVNHAIALAITVVFLLIGIWHGVGWNYAVFGLAQALGVVTVHYYTIFLKQKLGREGFKAYNQNPWIHAAGVAITFAYYAATLFFFANNADQMKQIFTILR